MKKLQIKSPKVSLSFKMFRVRANQENVDAMKEQILNNMNNWLQNNDG